MRRDAVYLRPRLVLQVKSHVQLAMTGLGVVKLSGVSPTM